MMLLLSVFGLYSSVSQARETYGVSIGPSGWSSFVGAGLVGPSLEFELQEESASIESSFGFGARCALGWALWPRLYLEGSKEMWRPFGEIGFAQTVENQIRLDSNCGPKLSHRDTWKFFGAGMGLAFRRYDRMLRFSLGVGLATGQCPLCGMQIYLSMRIGHFF
jgi:hypothetical protein